jgi:uncharacterized membrane protein (DUF485 family)
LRFNAAARRHCHDPDRRPARVTDPSPGTPPDDQPPPSSWAHNARIGLILFFLYLALYAGFIGIAAFNPHAMATPVLAGANLAIVYGLGLIVAAFALALLYMVLCHNEPPAEIHAATETEIEVALGSEGTP